MRKAGLNKKVRAISALFLILLLVAIPHFLSHQPSNMENTAPENNGLTDWVHYHNYTEIVSLLCTLNQTYPNAVDLFSIGKSVENRTIYCVRLTNESIKTPKPAVFFIGYHHANEQITSELTLYFTIYAATNFASNQTLRNLINKSEIYIVVALNVDGFETFQFLERARNNANGIDLNRNYGYGWNGGGPAPFSEPETRAVRDFALQHNFSYSLDFHSGTALILYPWAYTYDPPPDEAKFTEIAKNLSQVTGGTRFEQNSLLYIANGTFDDWMYGARHTFSLCCEIYGRPYGEEENIKECYDPYAESIEPVVLRWLPTFVYIMNQAINEDQHG